MVFSAIASSLSASAASVVSNANHGMNNNSKRTPLRSLSLATGTHHHRSGSSLASSSSSLRNILAAEQETKQWPSKPVAVHKPPRPQQQQAEVEESREFEDQQNKEADIIQSLTLSTCATSSNESSAFSSHPQQQVFRERRVWLDEDDEMESMWTLKRANPIYEADSDDEDVVDELEAMYASPPKRVRSSKNGCQRVRFSDSVQVNQNGQHLIVFALSEPIVD